MRNVVCCVVYQRDDWSNSSRAAVTAAQNDSVNVAKSSWYIRVHCVLQFAANVARTVIGSVR